MSMQTTIEPSAPSDVPVQAPPPRQVHYLPALFADPAATPDALLLEGDAHIREQSGLSADGESDQRKLWGENKKLTHKIFMARIRTCAVVNALHDRGLLAQRDCADPEFYFFCPAWPGAKVSPKRVEDHLLIARWDPPALIESDKASFKLSLRIARVRNVVCIEWLTGLVLEGKSKVDIGRGADAAAQVSPGPSGEELKEIARMAMARKPNQGATTPEELKAALNAIIWGAKHEGVMKAEEIDAVVREVAQVPLGPPDGGGPGGPPSGGGPGGPGQEQRKTERSTGRGESRPPDIRLSQSVRYLLDEPLLGWSILSADIAAKQKKADRFRSAPWTSRLLGFQEDTGAMSGGLESGPPRSAENRQNPGSTENRQNPGSTGPEQGNSASPQDPPGPQTTTPATPRPAPDESAKTEPQTTAPETARPAPDESAKTESSAPIVPHDSTKTDPQTPTTATARPAPDDPPKEAPPDPVLPVVVQESTEATLTRLIRPHLQPGEDHVLQKHLVLALSGYRTHDLVRFIRSLSKRWADAPLKDRIVLEDFIKGVASNRMETRFGELFNLFMEMQLPDFRKHLHALKAARLDPPFREAMEAAWKFCPEEPPPTAPEGASPLVQEGLQVGHLLKISRKAYWDYQKADGEMCTQAGAWAFEESLDLKDELKRLLLLLPPDEPPQES